MFVTSDMCACELSATNMYMILTIMILIIENKGRVKIAYPAAPGTKPTLVDVYTGCRCSHPTQCRAIMLQCRLPITLSRWEEARRGMKKRAVA
jgi:hypothetical protein